MDSYGKSPIAKFKWYFIVIYIAIALLIALAMFTAIFDRAENLQHILWLVGALIVLVAALVILAKVIKMTEVLQSNDRKLEQLISSLEKTRSTLIQLNNSSHLSETAKSIAFRETDQQTLREAVYDKLHQEDFETTSQIIAEIATYPQYQKLAEQLRAEAETYKNSSEKERIDRVIKHIEGLLEKHDWARASAQIEKLAQTSADENLIMQMRQKVVDKKQQRKRVLLNAWDEAVKRQATDRSLEILKDLDQYLTPNEGLALQEAARDVFRNKLHNLGVQFALAVSAKEWKKALKIGEEITEEFPNSKMAAEIRETRPKLEQKAIKPNQ